MKGLRLTYRVERVPFCFVAMAGGRRTLTFKAARARETGELVFEEF